MYTYQNRYGDFYKEQEELDREAIISFHNNKPCCFENERTCSKHTYENKGVRPYIKSNSKKGT